MESVTKPPMAVEIKAVIGQASDVEFGAMVVGTGVVVAFLGTVMWTVHAAFS